MNQLFAIALGGALGALSRYYMVGLVTQWLGKSFPYGTLLVNAMGSFAIGIAYLFVVEKFHATPEVRALLMVGFLGAFTTFSTFSLETVSLIQDGRLLTAISYVLSSVIICVLATAVGMMVARPMFN